MHTVSLTTAHRGFSRLMKEVERGKVFLITRRGRPIAVLVPHAAENSEDPVWAENYRQMMNRLGEGAPLGGLRIRREDLYGH